MYMYAAVTEVLKLSELHIEVPQYIHFFLHRVDFNDG